MNTYTRSEIARHSTRDDCWVIMHDIVYDVTDFIRDHPGGAKVIAHFGGKDISEEFDSIHRPTTLKMIAKKWMIGRVAQNACL